jgi:predicted nucleic acid-binding protein
MRYLVDSNVLLRLLQRNDPQYEAVRRAVRDLHADGHELCYAAQNIIEFWNVCTRDAASRGGFGLTIDETDRRVKLLERLFTLLEDRPTVYPEWRSLVVAHSVKGKQVHDARLVAVMKVHGVIHILTLNLKDFARYPGITAISP